MEKRFEFGTMLSFAIPGTVIGIQFISLPLTPRWNSLARALILIICFCLSGICLLVYAVALRRIEPLDKSLDEPH